MKTISMDYNLYKQELREEYGRGYRDALLQCAESFASKQMTPESALLEFLVNEEYDAAAMGVARNFARMLNIDLDALLSKEAGA